MDTIRTASEKTGNSVARTVREHPMPAALAAAGIAWLVTAAIRDQRTTGTVTAHGPHFGSSQFDDTRGEPAWRDAPGRAREMGRDASERAKYAASRTRENVEHAAEQARATASQFRHRASERVADAAHHARESAADLGHRAREGAAELRHRISDGAASVAARARDSQAVAAEKIRSGAAQARETAEHTFSEHPLTTGAAALALGIAAGLAIPSTRREREMMGRKRDELLREGRDYGEELMERGKHVAHAAVEAGKEAASHAGEDVKHTAKKAGEEVQDAVKDEARRQHLTPTDIKDEAKEKMKST